MAIFTVTNGEAANLAVVKATPIIQDCFTLYEYIVTTNQSDSITITLTGNHFDAVYTSNGIDTSFSDTVTFTFNNALSVRFLLLNSGQPSVFSNATIRIDNNTTVNYYENFVQRDDDSFDCFDKNITCTDEICNNGEDGINPYINLNDLTDLLNVNSIQFDTTPNILTSNPGLLQWNSTDDTADLIANGVTYQLGQEIAPLVRNTTGLTITNGTPVMFAGTLGASGRVLITPAIADGSIPSSYVLGTTTEDILNNQDGHVTWFGKVRDIDTTGTPYGEVWTDSDILYVSPITAGYLTNVKPEAPDEQIFIGVVINSHGTNGTLFVRPSWRGKITDLDDVNGTALTTTGQIMVWDQTNKYFDFTSNISDFTASTPSLQQVTDVGNTTTLNIAALSFNDLKLFAQIATHVNNISIGEGALSSNTGTDVIGIGTNSLSGNTGRWAVAVGPKTLTVNTLDHNTAVGNGAGELSNTANSTLIGSACGWNNSGAGLTALGKRAGGNNTGYDNVGIGTTALQDNTGYKVVAAGNRAGEDNTGNESVGIGDGALQRNTGNFVTAVGVRAGDFHKAHNSTCIGYQALTNVAITSSDLTAVGWNSGNPGGSVNYVNSTCIGASSFMTKSNQVTLGDSNVTEIYTDGHIKTHREISNDTTTTRNLILDDRNSIVTLNNAAAVSCIIPANASVVYPIGTQINLINLGAGVVTISITTDTLNQNIGGLTMAQYDKRVLTKVTATSWILSN